MESATSVRATTLDGYKLLHQGVQALARVEDNGMRVDVPYLDGMLTKIGREIEELETSLRADKFYKQWQKVFGNKANLGSREQLAHLLYEVLKIPCDNYTETGRPKADEEAFNKIDLLFVKDYLKLAKLDKVRGTYLLGIRREVVDDYLHPVVNLHTVVTYRSSASLPNSQNLPIRNSEYAEMIRRCFIPRNGHQIGECDYSGVEVKVAYCYHKDPTMKAYLEGGGDMHRDVAAECFLIPPGKVSKICRYVAKNQFVFPEFYGSYFAQCAPNMWNSIDQHKLEVDGVSLKEHLATKGITSLGDKISHWETGRIETRKGTFMEHIRRVEKRFWEERFPVYAAWKKKWWAAYQRTGEFDMLTGFHVSGVFARNDVINYPIQGSAFHCLLWSLVRIQRWLTKYKMRSKIICQIHDSLVLDLHKDEIDDVLTKCQEVMTIDLPRHWTWIITPLQVEAEVAPLGMSWFDKKPYEMKSVVTR